MEHLKGGELFDRIVAKERYTEEEARLAVRSLATGMAYFHDLGIVHRDVKVRRLQWLISIAFSLRSRHLAARLQWGQAFDDTRLSGHVE